ncbi:metalloregulator ArsR/SmtB family transcription factor [Halobacillus salinarum]|uniref:Metalloregulator ArsR/SmtB family transcription factor n=1 Tax=Halobacillus salinarum TaxID=2932257 RepID=A0ABY4ES42_9BACI|nr:metalloregulator ArsR/SmtB family transcription factor [Halobacillus salinarum]UOQ44951.1 metalloregulator ArsR/SmtB family transcription factor [Halobacillus salinarum]
MAAAQKHDVYQAIADPTRRKMLKLLAEGNYSITEIAGQFPVSRTAVVKHLQVLSDASLVADRKAGREKIYSLKADELLEVQEWLSFFEQYWDNKLAKLKHIVENEE